MTRVTPSSDSLVCFTRIIWDYYPVVQCEISEINEFVIQPKGPIRGLLAPDDFK